MIRLLLLVPLILLVSACLSAPKSSCHARIAKAQAAYDAAEADLEVASAAAEMAPGPQMFGRVASAAADVAGAKDALDSARKECGSVP